MLQPAGELLPSAGEGAPSVSFSALIAEYRNQLTLANSALLAVTALLDLGEMKPLASLRVEQGKKSASTLEGTLIFFSNFAESARREIDRLSREIDRLSRAIAPTISSAPAVAPVPSSGKVEVTDISGDSTTR